MAQRHLFGCFGSFVFCSLALVSQAAANPVEGFHLDFAPLADVVGRPPIQGSEALKRDLDVLRCTIFRVCSCLIAFHAVETSASQTPAPLKHDLCFCAILNPI